MKSDTEKRINERIGYRIKKARKAKGLNQDDLASLLDMSRTNLSNIETGRVTLSVWNLCRIAACLDVPVHAFLLPESNIQWSLKDNSLAQINCHMREIERHQKYIRELLTS